MRMHSSFLETSDVQKAARIAGVSFTRLSLHGSRKRTAAFDVILTGSSTRNQNQGVDKAATWDEWGIFLGVLFGIDPAMLTPYYTCAEDFHWQTNSRFLNVTAADFTRGHNHKWDYTGQCATGAYSVLECAGKNGCGAILRRGDFSAVSA